MPSTRCLNVLLVLLCCITLAGCAKRPTSHSPSATVRTLFVVPKTLPDGTPSDTARVAFESWLVDQAGGFTRMNDVTGAWKSPEGVVITEENYLYLVSIQNDTADFEAQLKEQIVQQFKQQEAYVERW